MAIRPFLPNEVISPSYTTVTKPARCNERQVCRFTDSPPPARATARAFFCAALRGLFCVIGYNSTIHLRAQVDCFGVGYGGIARAVTREPRRPKPLALYPHLPWWPDPRRLVRLASTDPLALQRPWWCQMAGWLPVGACWPLALVPACRCPSARILPPCARPRSCEPRPFCRRSCQP